MGFPADPEGLREELLRRQERDQALREAVLHGDAEPDATGDEDNTAWLRAVIETAGWPGASLVGEDGSHAAWLIAQHADLDPDFQRRCLALLEEAVAHREASAADLAYLTDRVRLSAGQPQLYGTQLWGRNGRYQPWRLADPDGLAARRAVVGLEPLDQYVARYQARHGPPAPASLRCVGCRAVVELWPPPPDNTARVACPSCGRAFAVTTRQRQRTTPA